MVDQYTYINGNTGGGGGGGGSTISASPSTRTISFTINSSPQGGAIYIDDVNTYNTTPHTLQYTEAELLTPKTISVKNGSSTSVETFIISSQIITNSGGSSAGSGGGGGGVSYGGGYGGGDNLSMIYNK
jgi:hypothetical protein